MAPSRRFLQPINLSNISLDPVSASSGDFYYNSASSTLRYFDGTEWKNVGEGGGAGVTISETAPENPVEGQGWFKSSTSELYFWDGSFWVEATSVVDNYLLFTVSASAPADPMEGTGWFDNTQGEFFIYDGTYWQQVTSVVQSIYGFTVGDTPPAEPVEGAGWFNNVEGEFYIYDGTYWQEVVRTVLVDLAQDPSPELSANLDANGYGLDNVGYIDFDTTPSASAIEGRLVWNDADGTLNIGLQNGVTLQTGQESHVYVKNETGSTIENAKVVCIIGSGETIPGHPGHPLIAEFIANGSINAADVIGVTTQNIEDNEHGYVTAFGMVRDLDTSLYTPGTILYASSASSGLLTDLQPISPNLTVVMGVVVESSSANGSIFINPRIYPTSELVTYNNSNAYLSATNVKGALDELSLGKADVNALSSNINLYPTTASADVSGYFTMVSKIDDPEYNDTAVNVPTGIITTEDQLLASLVSASGLIVGNPGIVGITTIGNIRKTAGNQNTYAEFYFKVFHRNSAGTETLIGTSDTTGAVNPTDLNVYQEFNSTALTNFIEFVESDRIVIKYYANIINAGNPQYEFQFGGLTPVRTLIPVPVSVIPIADASGILVNTSTFNGVLSPSDTTVQAALETLDDLDVLPNQTGNNGKFLTTDGINTSWDSIDLGTDTSGDYVQQVSGSGDGISVTGSGESASVTISNTGVTSLIGTANEVEVSASTGSVTIGLPSTINANTTGSAASLTTPRLIELSGDISGSANFDGSASAGISTTLSNTGVSASTYGSSSEIPILTIDEKGRITSASAAGVEGLPDQTGNDGKFLTTDGSTASWETVDALPDQTGNEGKYLTTDGTTPSWTTVQSGTIQTDVALSNSWWLGV